MTGAAEYCKYFKKTEQFGKLFIDPSYHARGRTIHVWVLPSEEKITGSIHVNKGAVEVYGITGGQPGWTETYGWLHEGPWQEDFQKLVNSKKLELEAKEKSTAASTVESAKREDDRIKDLLAQY